jgi:hypothetical protein
MLFRNSSVAICVGCLRDMLLKTSEKNFIVMTEAMYLAEGRYTGT